MRKAFLVACLSLSIGSVWAQQKVSKEYFVYTDNVKSETAGMAESSDTSSVVNRIPDFVNDNFRFYSLCDWKPGMRFMVLPERYDMIVNTFCDENNQEVSSVSLSKKIMRYVNHTKASNNHEWINFVCEDNGKRYHYEIPNGTFDDYCGDKKGVPTLAYLGDVDIADSLLKGRKLYTTSKIFYRDTNTSGEGAEQVVVKGNIEVEVVKVGVGTRSFPVKIIVKDEDGNQFFQNVAISKTNSGMRDNEFIMDNARHTFYGSFGLMDAPTAVSQKYSDYVGMNVFTKRSMKMKNEKSDKLQGVPRMTGFLIESIRPSNNGDNVTLRLKNNNTAGYFLKEVTFNGDVIGAIDGREDNYFGSLFAEGEGKEVGTTMATRAMINLGHVGTGFTEDEVLQAVGEPEKVEELLEGRYNWYFTTATGKTLVVTFGTNNTVIKTEARAKTGGKNAKGGNSRRGAAKSARR